jgi:ubiquinone/menaquinone biosynthesis C-methylase UbiE
MMCGTLAVIPHRECLKMDSKLQRRVQRYGWDKAASQYERSWQRQLEPAQSALFELADLKPGTRILDVACGTGLVALKAAAAVTPSGQVIGTDISEQMVLAAQGIAVSRGITNARFERVDAEQSAFGDNSFDVVLCALGLMYVPDPERAIRDFHRVLRPGGRAVCAVWGQRSKCAWAEIFPIVDARVHSEVCPMFFRLGTAQNLQEAFKTAGFGEIVERRLETRLEYATGDEACDAAFVGGPVALAYSHFSPETRLEARKEYLASIEAYRIADNYSIPGEFVVVAGRK